MSEQLTSRRPYLLRATYEWLADNFLTPYLLVNAKVAGVLVPAHTVQDGQVVLNIGMNAVKQLELANDAITFQARFAGKVESLYIPMASVVAIYARENQQGLVLPQDEVVEAEASHDGPHKGQSQLESLQPRSPQQPQSVDSTASDASAAHADDKTGAAVKSESGSTADKTPSKKADKKPGLTIVK